MIKARNRKLSMLLVLAMLMTMFVGVGTASAADMYSVGSVNAIEKSTDTPIRIGTITVTAYNFPAGQDKGFIVKLPDGFKITDNGTNPLFDSSVVYNAVYAPSDPINSKAFFVVAPLTDKGGKAGEASILVAATGQQNRVKVIAASGKDLEELKFNLTLNAKTPSTVPSEVKVMIAKEPGSVFADNLGLVIATSGTGSVQAIANDPIDVKTGEEVEISIRANTSDALKKLSFKLPAGFSWQKETVSMTRAGSKTPEENFKDTDRTVEFTFDKANNQGIWTFKGKVDVDESRAKFGDVVVSLSGSSVSPSSVTIGTYSDFGIEVSTSDVPTVLAGRTEVEIADIEIKELSEGSLVNKRTIYFTLPAGTRWVSEDSKLVMEDFDKSGSIDNDKDDVTVYSNKKEMAKITIENEDANDKGSITIEAAQIEIAPDFVGDINVEISGSAGISETIKVAEVIAPVTVKADVTDIKIGLQAQAGGNIVITEAEAEALRTTETIVYKDKDDKEVTEVVDAFLTLKAPQNVQWAKVPTVKVVEGDLEIDTVTRVENNRELSFRIKESSTVASKIEISDVVWTVDRTVPEGDMKVTVAGNAVVQAVFTNRTSVTSFVAAKVVTPAPGETVGNGEFRIGSNIYYVGGAAKVMDVAPYIKDSRTYVPMRYAAEIIGAEVVWDDAARTVTLTKGDDVAVFTIGSTTYTVNGEAMTADVAPEISNSRTMLPARFVAEAFGAVVGWDAGTQTVLIQK